jgi:hypothetical protein
VPTVKLGQPDTTLNATVKILDIGLGRALFEEGAAADGNVELTTEGAMLGTPAYLAPEQARDAHSADIRADIYSLGCVLYHALAGQAPFADTNLVRQMVRHATEPPKPLKYYNPEVPDGLDQIVQWMLAKDPAQRYPTPDRAAQALQVFLASAPDARRLGEGDAEMQAYLQWLEVNPTAGAAASPAPPAGAASAGAGKTLAAVPTARPVSSPRSPAVPTAKPVAKPVTAAAPVRPAGAPRTGKPLARPSTRAAAPAQADVELVPTAPPRPPGPAGQPATSFLSRRELLLLALGAGGVLLALLFGLIIWLIVRPSSKKDDPPLEEVPQETR